MTIKILVMKSGEDVIADVKEMMSPDEKVMGYFLNRPCVVKLLNSTELSSDSGVEEEDVEQVKSEMRIRMFPWMPLAKEKDIPLSTDWVVTMISPVEKVLQMYVEDVLPSYGQETNKGDGLDQSSKAGLTD